MGRSRRESDGGGGGGGNGDGNGGGGGGRSLGESGESGAAFKAVRAGHRPACTACEHGISPEGTASTQGTVGDVPIKRRLRSLQERL